MIENNYGAVQIGDTQTLLTWDLHKNCKFNNTLFVERVYRLVIMLICSFLSGQQGKYTNLDQENRLTNCVNKLTRDRKDIILWSYYLLFVAITCFHAFLYSNRELHIGDSKKILGIGLMLKQNCVYHGEIYILYHHSVHR